MSEHFLFTKEGLEKIKAELLEIKEVRLKQIAQRLKEARELGDLSENSEYEEAKNEQAFVSGRASELEKMIKYAEVISENRSCTKVDVGCRVVVEADGNKESYAIVGSAESDPVNGYISADSPLGRSLIGSKKGDKIKVAAPAGQIEYKIVNIE